MEVHGLGGAFVKASILVVRDTGMILGALAFSVFTLMMINSIVIVPTVLLIRELLDVII